MNNINSERRRMSHAGLLDTAIRQVASLAYHPDIKIKAIAGEALATLLRLRREIPSRRASDNHSRPR